MSKEKKRYYIWLKNTINTHDGKDQEPEIKDMASAQQAVKYKRQILKNHYSAKNAAFCKRHNLDALYSATYTHCIIALMSDDELTDVQKDVEVNNITEFREVRLKAFETDIISRQIGVDSITGTHTDGRYLGNGVKIGAISAENLTYITNDAQLRGLEEEGRLVYLGENAPSEQSVHSSVVISIIVGRSITVDDVEYRGVAPESTVYLVPSFSVTDVYRAIEKCIDNGAIIINYSAGEAFPDGQYSDFDRQIDAIIYNVGICFITAAGNASYVSSPATAYNAITVGNAQTKGSLRSALTPPYPMFCVAEDECSAYIQADYLPNKPDLCAPGTYVHYINSRGDIRFNLYGTSFAAPYVTGVAAQIVQKYPNANLMPLIIKGLLLNGADPQAISTDNNPVVSEFDLLRTKSGAGLLNSINSLGDIRFSTGTVVINDTRTHGGHADINLNAGRSVRVLLCYEKSADETALNTLKNNITLEIYTPAGTRAAFSDSAKENVKLIEYTASQSGRYTVTYYLRNFDADGANIPYILAWRYL